MNQKTKISIVLLFLISNASALQDINITIDSMGLDLCITQNITYQTCNQTSVIQLDGTQDHILYFTTKNSDIQTNHSIVYTDPLMIIYVILSLVFFILVCLVLVRFIK